MIFALMLGAAWWQVIPAYFLIGAVWAVLYLPRSIALQARAYKAWRSEVTEDEPLATVFSSDLVKRKNRITPEKFRQWRDAERFTERAILTGFMLNIAFWPLRVLETFFMDFLQVAVRWLLEILENFWEKVVVVVCRWIWRVLRRGLMFIWRRVLAPAYRWVYGRVTAVYQSIIHRANREAIADMAIMNSAPQEEK